VAAASKAIAQTRDGRDDRSKVGFKPNLALAGAIRHRLLGVMIKRWAEPGKVR